ncbi:MAG TPA: FAD-linked oxidase C-terminal domain-containing protein [Terriglobales bacterium]|nr:FAD-linked oxidase C-terminal domain-containing protein [Terriglobales bacterium]
MAEAAKAVTMEPGAWRKLQVDAAGLEAELRLTLEGEVRFDAGSRAAYTVDGSNYRQAPIGVVIPKTVEDVVQTVGACRKFGAPVLSRGAGTSLAGQCCNVAVVMDWTKYLHKIVEINAAENYARVQPGLICDRLREAVAPHKLTWGPDPATHTHCTFGGMLGNNSCGVHSQMSGKAVENVHEMEVLLYDGTRMKLGWMSEAEMQSAAAQGGREGEIYGRLLALRNRYAGLIRERYPRIPRRVSGYNLDELLPGADGRCNVARALVGSEGTCVAMLEAKVRLIPSKPARVLVLLGYPDMYLAGDDVPRVIEFGPIGLEGFDEIVAINIRKKRLPQQDYLSLMPKGSGWLLVEFGADTKEEALAQATRFAQASQGKALEVRVFTEAEQQRRIWLVRESALGANSFVPGEKHSWEGWEDSAVAPERIGPYLRELRALYDKYGYTAALYGHFGQGCVHCRVDFDLETAAGIQKFREFMEEAVALVVSYDGSLSGEHGDGQSRAEFLDRMFGPELVEAFREFKSIWDPQWKMNPGKVVDPYRIEENLRLGAGYVAPHPVTHFQFPDDHGSFAHATLRCVGVGRCRRWSGQGDLDTMCPSFMVTHEERHSTRGRAHLLWEMLHGEVIKDGWRDEQVKEALDLCLACKGCKGDCPVNVDVATFKAEFLSHYWEGRLRPLHAYAFGWIDKWARLASVAPSLANLFTQAPGLSALAKVVAGIPQQRTIPAFATETFRSWFRKRGVRNHGKPRVILWPDTFNNYFKPQTSQAAVEVLESAGYQVSVPQQHLCCGRPLYDYGFLNMAKSYLQRVVGALETEIEAGTPMVVLEPSCGSVFRDDLLGLMPESKPAQNLAQQTFTLAEFLEKNGCPVPRIARKAIVHGHCHHKAIMRLKEEKQVMEKMGLEYRLLESGCCGMAGAFGYEKEHYDVSVAVGERVLLPAVRQAEETTLIIADGFSCQSQIEQQAGRKALHLAEVLAMGLKELR